MISTMVNLKCLKDADGFQSRVHLDVSWVERLSERIAELTDEELRAGGPDVPPPIMLFARPGESRYWIGDGFHRIASYRMAERSRIPAHLTLCEDPEEAAFKYALSANESHGKPRSHEDRERAFAAARERYPDLPLIGKESIQALLKIPKTSLQRLDSKFRRGRSYDADFRERKRRRLVELERQVLGLHRELAIDTRTGRLAKPVTAPRGVRRPAAETPVTRREGYELHVGDCREVMARLPEGSVQAVVTSPPYFGLRDYDNPAVRWNDGEVCPFGLETTVASYVRHSVEVFEGIRRVLRDDGVVWWVIGDSHAGWKNSHGASSGVSGYRQDLRPERASDEFTPGNRLMVPYRVAIALQDEGWVVRSTVIWAKPHPLPESVLGVRWEPCDGGTGRHAVGACSGCDRCRGTDGLVLRQGSWRPTFSHEVVLMVTKSADYFADSESAAEAADGIGRSRGPCQRSKHVAAHAAGQDVHRGAAGLTDAPVYDVRNPRDVWSIDVSNESTDHFATFPPVLARRCIEASTSAAGCCPNCGMSWAPVTTRTRLSTTKTALRRIDGYRPTCGCPKHEPVPSVVLDPFAGTGTTVAVARSLGRYGIGIDANADFIQELAVPKIEGVPLRAERAEVASR